MDDFVFRRLEKSDYTKGFIDLLCNLTTTGNFSEVKFNEIFEKINGEIYVFEKDNKIIASGTILFEQKFIHSGGIVAHLEDVVVHPEYRGFSIGKKLIENLVKISKERGCYKIIGDCKESLLGFYGKNGFENRGYQIAIYFN